MSRDFPGKRFNPGALLLRFGHRNPPGHADALECFVRAQPTGNQKTRGNHTGAPHTLSTMDRDVFSSAKVRVEIVDQSLHITLGRRHRPVNDGKGSKVQACETREVCFSLQPEALDFVRG